MSDERFVTVDVWRDWLENPPDDEGEWIDEFDDVIFDLADGEQDAIAFWDDQRMTIIDAFIELVHEIERLQGDNIALQDQVESLATGLAEVWEPHAAAVLMRGCQEGYYGLD